MPWVLFSGVPIVAAQPGAGTVIVGGASAPNTTFSNTSSAPISIDFDLARTYSFPVLQPNESEPRKVSTVVNNLMSGKMNNVLHVVLETGTHSTTVSFPLVNPESLIVLMPVDSRASGEMGRGTVYVSTREKGSFTIAHESASGSRHFVVAIFS